MAVPVNESSLLCNSSTLDPALDWCFRVNHLNYIVVCFEQELIPQNGLWQVSSGKNVTFKTFIVQLALIICINRLLISLFRTLHLPHIAAEILGGLLLGTSGIAKTPLGFGVLYPPSEVVLLETVAHLGLVFYMFMVGLEMDIKPILKTPKEALIVAAFGFILPLPVGCALHYMFAGNAANFGPVVAQYGPIFWGLALSTTNFPDLAQILEDTKLLHSEIGRTALSAAAVTDIFSWAILVITISIVKGVHVYTIVFGSIFVVFSLTVLPPILNWFLQRRRRHDDFYFYYDDDYHIYLVLIGVVIYGYVTDFLGLHSIIGAFLFGLIMPKQGELRRVLMERVEDFVTGIMMPLFFLIIGLRTNRQDVFEGQFRMSTIVGVIVLAFGVKITSTFIAAVFCNKMSPRDGLALGFLMNTKGMLSLIVINSARNVKVLNNQTFTMIIIALWCMTIAVCPILTMTYKKSLKQSKKRMHRSLTSLQPTSELRVLTCFHSSYEVTGIINLLDASNPTRYSPISVYAIRLIENFGRTTAINIVHGACKPINMKGGEDHKEHAAFAAFNGFKNGNKEGIFIQPLTAVSAPATMHEHICDFAEENHANMVILPFHLKTITNVGKTGSSASSSGTNLSKTNLDFRNINKKVMAKCSCSVAILVDRGHRPPTAASVQAGHNFLVLFVGGPDDREVLAYVQRMSGSRNVALTVMRFVAAANTEDEEDFFFDYKEEKDKLLDEQYFEEFRHKMYENPLVSFTQAVVRNVEEIVRAIGTIEKEYDLIIVGKGRGGRGSLSKMLGEAEKEWSDYPELGLLGDTLVCSNFASNAWILVVQQASGCDVRLKDEHLGSCGKLSQHCAHMTWQPSVNEKPELALFVSRA